MLTNSQMTEGRFLRWHKARVLVGKINAALESGATVQLTTNTRVTRYTKKHLGMFKAARNGAFVQSGKSWSCIDFTKVTAYR